VTLALAPPPRCTSRASGRADGPHSRSARSLAGGVGRLALVQRLGEVRAVGSCAARLAFACDRLLPDALRAVPRSRLRSPRRAPAAPRGEWRPHRHHIRARPGPRRRPLHRQARRSRACRRCRRRSGSRGATSGALPVRGRSQSRRRRSCAPAPPIPTKATARATAKGSTAPWTRRCRRRAARRGGARASERGERVHGGLLLGARGVGLDLHYFNDRARPPGLPSCGNHSAARRATAGVRHSAPQPVT
jgi:hypothetical protein